MFSLQPFTRATRVALLVGFGLVWGQAESAFASTFSVSPTRLTLASGVTSAVLTLKNDSTHAIHFELSVFAWDQTDDGRMRLEDTDDVVVYPPLVSLGPGQSRRVRIGTAVPFADVEKTYRVFVEELPDETKPAAAGHVRVRTRMGIPVFLQGRAATTHVAIGKAAAAEGLLSFELYNNGTKHALAQRIQIRGRSAAGEQVYAQEVDGWYLLARRRQIVSVALPEEDCSRVSRIDIHAAFGHGTVTQHVDVPSSACRAQ